MRVFHHPACNPVLQFLPRVPPSLLGRHLSSEAGNEAFAVTYIMTCFTYAP